MTDKQPMHKKPMYKNFPLKEPPEVSQDELLLTMNRHAIKELFYSFHKNGGDLDYCTDEVIRLAEPIILAKVLKHRSRPELREKMVRIFVEERKRYSENYERHREIKPKDKQALDYGLGYCAALQFCINNVDQILALCEEEIRKDERERMIEMGDFLLTGYKASQGYEVVRQFWEALKEEK